MAVLIAGCGGGGGGGDSVAVAKDTTPPRTASIEAQAPGTATKIDLLTSGATDIPAESFFVAVVDEATQCPAAQPVNATFGNVTGAYTCVSGAASSVLKVVPTAVLAAGTTYTLTLSPQDLAGTQTKLTTLLTVAPLPATVTL